MTLHDFDNVLIVLGHGTDDWVWDITNTAA